MITLHQNILPRVVVHTDDTLLFEDIKESLAPWEYTVVLYSASFDKKTPSVVLVDTTQEDKKWVISKGPILYIVSHENSLSAESLSSGYVLKPLDEHSLNVAIKIAAFKYKHNLGATSMKGSHLYLHSECTYDIISGRFYRGGLPISLPKKEHTLAQVLIDNLNKEVNYGTIFTALWGSELSRIDTLRAIAMRLRKKLGITKALQAVTNTGYQLNVVL